MSRLAPIKKIIDQPAPTVVLPQRTSLSLRANFLWTLAGNIIYAACQWGMLTVLAKLGTPEMVGQFALGLAVTAPIIMFTNLQLRGVQATDARQEFEFGHYLGLRLIGTTTALLLIGGIALFGGYRAETALVVLAIGCAKAFEAISDVFYGLLQQHEQMDRIAKSMIIKGPASLVALGAGVYFTGSVLGGAIGLALSWALLLLIYDLPSGKLLQNRPSLKPLWDVRALTHLTWLALPLGVVMMLNSLTTNVPRYFIERFWGEYELGIYAALTYLMVAGTTVVSALGQSASPRLSKHYAAGDVAAFCSLLLKLVGVGALIGASGMLITLGAGRQILTLLYRPEYAEHADILLLVVVAASVGFMASFLGYGMTAARYFRAQLPLFLVVSIIAVLSSMVIIPHKGLYGSVIVLIIVMASQFIGSAMIIFRALYALTWGS